MRDIKFRAFHKETKEMYGIRRIDFSVNEVIVDKLIKEWGYPCVNMEKIEIMQYTGLKDINGVEIYEGDILFHPLQGRRKVYYPYSERVASYGLRDIDSGFGSTLQDSHAVWEVIGNIWENPELLGIGEL